jgi:signal transduction histidine kinase
MRAAVTVFALANLLDVLRAALDEGRTSPDWQHFTADLFGSVCLGLAPWFAYPATLVGLIPMVLAPVRGGPTGVEALVIVSSLIALTVKSVRWPLWTMVGLYTTWAVMIVFITGSNVTGWFYGTVIFVSVLAGLALRHFVIERVQTLQRIAALEAEEQRSVERRKHLARELHDGMSHRLAIISGQAMLHRNDDDIEQLRAALMRAEEASRTALDELHSLMRFLRNTPESGGLLAPDPNADLITPLRVKEIAPQVDADLRAAGFTPAMRISPEAYNLASTAQTTVSRILQEAATNIMRYAEPASSCLFVVLIARHRIQVRILSTLRTTPPPADLSTESSSELGLRGVFERIRMLGGEADYGPVDDEWVVNATFPRH